MYSSVQGFFCLSFCTKFIHVAAHSGRVLCLTAGGQLRDHVTIYPHIQILVDLGLFLSFWLLREKHL